MTAGISSLAEKPVPRPSVERRCKVCEKTRGGWADDALGVVSPTGLEHIGQDYGDTACGRDATPDGWWWPL